MRRALIALLMWLLFTLPFSSVHAQQDDRAARELLAALNAWRVQNNLWPLSLNATLQALAVDQANYVLSLPAVPEGGTIHLGRQGETPRDRARGAPYRWPVYGRQDRVDVAEIAYDGLNASRAIAYWQGSDTHRTAALNQAYREVGIAAVPGEYGRLFLVVLGGRPDVLPTLFDSATSTLYLSNEGYQWAAGGPWIGRATEIQIFDGEGRPLGSRQPWQRTISVPSGVDGRLFVVYSEGPKQVISEVRSTAGDPLPAPAVALAQPTLSPTTAARATPTVPPTPTLAATARATPTVPPTPTLAAMVRTPLPAAPSATGVPLLAQAATRVPTATPIPTASPLAPAGPPDVTVIYDQRSLAIINTSGRPVDLSGLALAQGATLLPAARWAGYLSGSLTAFPAGDCLQAWSIFEAADLPAPPGCRYQRGVTYLASQALFWAQAAFEVQVNGTSVVTCAPSAGRCLVDLP